MNCVWGAIRGPWAGGSLTLSSSPQTAVLAGMVVLITPQNPVKCRRKSLNWRRCQSLLHFRLLRLICSILVQNWNPQSMVMQSGSMLLGSMVTFAWNGHCLAHCGYCKWRLPKTVISGELEVMDPEYRPCEFAKAGAETMARSTRLQFSQVDNCISFPNGDFDEWTIQTLPRELWKIRNTWCSNVKWWDNYVVGCVRTFLTRTD